jgi:HK97 family phage portal protein
MGVFARAATEFRGYRLEQFSPQSTAYWVAKLFGGGFSTASGISVTPEVALTEATVFSACRNLAEDLAALPINIYRGNASGVHPADIDYSTPAYTVLNRMANPEMTAMSFKETLHGHVALRGDGFAEKEMDQGLRLKALWPLNPARMRMARNGQAGFIVNGAPDGKLFFLYTLPSGQEKVFDSSLIFHPRGFGPDGLRGYSLVGLMREAIGLSLAADTYISKFYANDASPGSVLTHPKTLSDKARTNIELSWKDTHQGLDNAHRIAILEEGLSLAKVGIDPVDAQFLETRKFQRDVLGMVLRMPPDKLGNFERATYSNMEQSDINYVRYTLTPRATRFEQQLSADGVVDSGHMAIHDYIALLRGDSVARAAYYHSLRVDGAISGEDIRWMENFAPSGQKAASEILIPLNLMPASAFRPDGMTVLQLAKAALDMAKGGWVPEDINKFLGLGDLRHTGLMPGTASPAAGEANGEADATGDGSSGEGASAADGSSTRFLDDEVGRRLLALLEGRSNGHADIPVPGRP